MIVEYRNMNVFRTLFISIILMFSGLFVSAQNVEAYSRLDTNTIMIGDQIELELGITIPESFAVSFPFYQDTITSNIEVIEKQKLDTTKSDEGILIKQLYTITSFDSGYFQLPDFEFLFHHEEDTVLYRTNTKTLYLMVNTPVVDTSQAFKIIKGPIKEPYTFAEILPWVLLGVAVITLVAFLIWYIMKRRKNQPVFIRRPKPVLPPDVLAIQKLEELRLAKIWQQGKLKKYFTELTDIIREYFDGRFDIDAMEMTSDEIIEALRGKDINDQALDKIRNVLELADLVKFAKGQTTPLENDLSLNHCLDVVNETKPVFKPENEENKKINKPVVKEEA